MNKELTTKENTLPSTENMLDAWTCDEMTSSDLAIPRIILMQSNSPQVGDDKAKMGDLWDTMKNKVVGNVVKSPLDFIPIDMEKLWVVKERPIGVQTSHTFKEVLPMKDHNELPWNDIGENVEIKRIPTWVFYCHIEGELYCIPFRATAGKEAAGKLATQIFYRNKRARLVPSHYHISLHGMVKTNAANNKFAVLDITPGKASTKEEIAECFTSFKLIRSGKTRVEHDDADDIDAGSRPESKGTGEF